MSLGRRIRIGVLLLILAAVALDAWLTRARSTDWDRPLWVMVFPIVADDRDATRTYVKALTRDAFVGLEAFLQREAARHGLPLAEPLHVELGRTLDEIPPLPARGAGRLDIVWWSLKLRRWANRMQAGQPGPRAHVRIFVLYYDPAAQQRVAHSLGLQKGLIGVVHAFASRPMTPTNNVVIAHELLHTLGATDKYDPATSLPRFPDGYAEPQRDPLHPQAAAEIMGGRIPLSEREAEIPLSLHDVKVGALTAREIGWEAATRP